jgi:ectoine hydroxylase-related dioxygenase (phytanoyl-CoA dioxygenase family)
LVSSQAITSIAKVKLNDPHYRFLPSDVPNYVLQYYNARSSGQKLDLHIDSHIPFAGEFTNMMQFVILLEDSTVDNGCTVVVPGSHKSARFTDRELENVIPLTAKAGDLVCWDSRVWHGTLANVSKKSRWALIATLGMWWVKPSMDIVRGMNPEIYLQCNNQQKQLLGFCAVPPINPMERNNTKCGYDFLKPTLSEYNF